MKYENSIFFKQRCRGDSLSNVAVRELELKEVGCDSLPSRVLSLRHLKAQKANFSAFVAKSDQKGETPSRFLPL